MKDLLFKNFILFKSTDERPAVRLGQLEQLPTSMQPESDYHITKEKMLNKADGIYQLLKSLPDTQASLIVVGSEDFFDSTLGHACFDMRAVYEVMANELKALSESYPNVLFCPGSLYISATIPDTHYQCSYIQHKRSEPTLASTTCYVSNIMPVYHNGELIRIIRKGDYLQEKIARAKGVDLRPIISADELSLPRNPPPKLIVTSYHEDELDSIIMRPAGDEVKELSGVCYLGKTYLPGEIALIKSILGENIDTNALMNHEFEIQGSKCLALICAEFLDKNGTTINLLDNNHYDYVIHSTNGVRLGKQFEGQLNVYVHSDQGGMTEIAIYDENGTYLPSFTEVKSEGMVVKKF